MYLISITRELSLSPFIVLTDIYFGRDTRVNETNSFSGRNSSGTAIPFRFIYMSGVATVGDQTEVSQLHATVLTDARRDGESRAGLYSRTQARSGGAC